MNRRSKRCRGAADRAGVAKALQQRGYQVDDSSDLSGEAIRSQMLSAVDTFISDAGRGETLLIYLSGHGTHRKGVTYLVPSDARRDVRNVTDYLVTLQAWQDAIEESRAEAIVFLVDACREGFEEQATMSDLPWSADKRAAAERRQVAWLYPCHEGEMTRWVTAGQAAGEDSGGPVFSLFARAIVGSLEDRATPATVTGFAEAVRERLGELSARYGKQVQRPQLQLSDGYRTFDIFPVRSGDPHDWERAAADHEAWKLVADGADVKEMREDTLTLVRHLTKARLTAGSPGGTSRDAWTDAGFAARMSTQLEFLLTSVKQSPERAAEGSFTLSPAEASLLAAAPYLHDTHWATQRADFGWLLPAADPAGDPARESFDRFTQGFPRLRRRAAADPGEAGDQLGWWLLHRWLQVQVEASTLTEVARLLPKWPSRSPGRNVFTDDRLRTLLRVVRADNGFFADPDGKSQPPEKEMIAGGRRGEQELRLRLVAYLAAVAYQWPSMRSSSAMSWLTTWESPIRSTLPSCTPR